MFKRREREATVTTLEYVFQTVADMTRDLDKRELNRLIEGITLTWEAWQKIKQARTAEDKELDAIDMAEKMLNE